jgi:hypothetical protein
VGGYVIVDDYGAVPQCKEAVTDFRAAHQIIDPMETVDWTGVYWQRGRPEGTGDPVWSPVLLLGAGARGAGRSS